jgi:6-phosphogluconolactonase (cycloisomerase 2 family)
MPFHPSDLIRALLLSSAVLSGCGIAIQHESPPATRVALYAATGGELTHWTVDLDKAELAGMAAVSCPANIQYAWPHPSKRYLYVAWSDGGPSGAAGAPSGGARHGVTAFRVGASGELTPHGDPVPLISRPVHITVDGAGANLLVAHTIPSALTVYRIRPDGTLGEQVRQQAPPNAGIYAHQVRVDPSNREAIVVARGNAPAKNKPEDPGSLQVFAYDNGEVANRAAIAPGGGFGFQPRHLDYHPSQPWVFVSVERQNQLQVYRKLPAGGLSTTPLFTATSLAPGTQAGAGQAASTVHVHPNGKYVYQGNRAAGTIDFNGSQVFAGGENSIAVFEIGPATGEPRLVQNADTHGISPRTFALDPEGRILVAANQVPILARRGDSVEQIPANLAVFRIDGAGRLTFVRNYPIEATNAESLFWMGLIPLP